MLARAMVRSIANPARLVQPNQPVVRFQVLEEQPVAVQQKRYACGRYRRPLVSLQKRMILRQALEPGGGFFDGIGVVSAIETSHGGLQSFRCLEDRGFRRTCAPPPRDR